LWQRRLEHDFNYVQTERKPTAPNFLQTAVGFPRGPEIHRLPGLLGAAAMLRRAVDASFQARPCVPCHRLERVHCTGFDRCGGKRSTLDSVSSNLLLPFGRRVVLEERAERCRDCQSSREDTSEESRGSEADSQYRISLGVMPRLHRLPGSKQDLRAIQPAQEDRQPPTTSVHVGRQTRRGRPSRCRPDDQKILRFMKRHEGDTLRPIALHDTSKL